MGDYNNRLDDVPELYDDEEGRCVVIEIQSLEDVVQGMAGLNALGIFPSSAVFAYHGDTLQAPIGRKPPASQTTAGLIQYAAAQSRALVGHANRHEGKQEGFRGYALESLGRALANIVEHGMQPSRGEDDAASMEGKKVFVFNACHGDSEGIKKTVNSRTGERIGLGETTLIAELAEVLAAQRISSEVSVYGINGRSQVHPTPRGMAFSVRPEGQPNREHAMATRIDVQGGTISRTPVVEVPLRNFDKPVQLHYSLTADGAPYAKN
jgi:hypothetical protein